MCHSTAQNARPHPPLTPQNPLSPPPPRSVVSVFAKCFAVPASALQFLTSTHPLVTHRSATWPGYHLTAEEALAPGSTCAHSTCKVASRAHLTQPTLHPRPPPTCSVLSVLAEHCQFAITHLPPPPHPRPLLTHPPAAWPGYYLTAEEALAPGSGSALRQMYPDVATTYEKTGKVQPPPNIPGKPTFQGKKQSVCDWTRSRDTAFSIAAEVERLAGRKRRQREEDEAVVQKVGPVDRRPVPPMVLLTR